MNRANANKPFWKGKDKPAPREINCPEFHGSGEQIFTGNPKAGMLETQTNAEARPNFHFVRCVPTQSAAIAELAESPTTPWRKRQFTYSVMPMWSRLKC